MNNETIKLIRRYLKMNQYKFAEYIEVTYSTLAEIEAGSRRVTDNVISKIARKFDVSEPDFQEFVKRNHELKKFIEANSQGN